MTARMAILADRYMSLVIETSTVHGPSDEQLLTQMRLGSTRAFAELYHRYKHKMYAYCYKLLRSPEATEDVLQETFLKIHRGIHLIQNPEMVRTWMFSIARNEAFTYLRRTRHLVDLDEETESVWEMDNPLDIVANQETREIVQHCLDLLKPHYRELLILREYNQLSYAEIAEITGLTESAVKSALFKARRALVKKLEPIFNDERHL